MTPATLREAIEAGTAPAILDVRSRWEYVRGHVPGAQHIPFWTVWLRLPEIRAPREAPLVIYCGHGPRAWMAAAVLRRRGFQRLRYLDGHWAAWQRGRLPVSRG